MAKRRKRDTRLKFLVMARTTGDHHPHPVEVALHPAGAQSRMSFSVGPHPLSVGTQTASSNVLDESRTGLNPMFASEFDAADLHWLVPHLVRLHAGEDVTDEIVVAYTDRYGRAPEVMHQEHSGN